MKRLRVDKKSALFHINSRRQHNKSSFVCSLIAFRFSTFPVRLHTCACVCMCVPTNNFLSNFQASAAPSASQPEYVECPRRRVCNKRSARIRSINNAVRHLNSGMFEYIYAISMCTCTFSVLGEEKIILHP